jgi:hypothetical protein
MVLLKNPEQVVLLVHERKAVVESIQEQKYNNLKRMKCRLSEKNECKCLLEFQYHSIDALKAIRPEDRLELQLFLSPSAEWENPYEVKPIQAPNCIENLSQLPILCSYGSFLKQQCVQIGSGRIEEGETVFSICHFSFHGINTILQYDLNCYIHRPPATSQFNQHIQLLGRDCVFRVAKSTAT